MTEESNEGVDGTVHKASDMQEFIFEVPLYQKTTLKNPQDFSRTLRNEANPFDAFCPHCNNESIFERSGPHYGGTHGNGRYDLNYKCRRNSDHSVLAFVLKSNDTFTKIGQFPSLADIAQKDAAPLVKQLSKTDRHEFSKAIGLAAHGVGIGSFVYLRRVFERLLDRRFELHKDQVDAEQYRRSKVVDKIDMLQDYLPKFLVEHKTIYGILSVGVHELSEEACRSAFPLMKESIEIILEEDLRLRKEEERRKALSTAINKLNADISASRTRK
ncbi:short-chain dehydrogenase [Microvirga subterranea]|uniref:short-chain dehydrogenase n=1 Tax=Microvirga subterranea TaxID=186651 RepID=UPI0011C03EAE|nr:short-chain dehydrogenase [Microvirga subterranea]